MTIVADSGPSSDLMPRESLARDGSTPIVGSIPTGGSTLRGSRSDRLTALVDAYVVDALRPFLTGADKHAFLPAGIEGAVVYGRVARVVVAVGDPIGPDRWAAFDRLRMAAARRRIATAVYQATEAGRDQLAARGFHVVPVGQEAIVDLSAFSLAGSQRANLRHTITRARRGGVTVEWHPNGLLEIAAGLLNEIVQLDNAWRERAGPPMGFTITQFEPELLRGNPVAVAFDAGHRPIAVATFRPSGSRSYVLDVIRRQPGATPGALEACIAEAAAAFAASGATHLSLGLAPLSGLDAESAQPEERWLARSTNLARGAYDVDGLAFFKGKFDPAWHTRYLAFETRRDFPAVVAGLLWLHLARPGQPLGVVAGDIARGLARAAQAEWHARSQAARARADEDPLGSVPRTAVRDRLAVAGLAGAGLVLGRRFANRAGRRTFGSIGAATAGLVAMTAAGSRRSRSLLAASDPADIHGDALPRVTVLVPARNEERVLPELVLDLAAQDHRDQAGRPRFNVIVIDDRSSDQTLHRTLEVARQAGIADVLEVRQRRGRSLPDGKGAALAFVPPDQCAEAVLVLDADARLAPGSLRLVAARMASGMSAFTLRRSVRDPGHSWLTQAQADEQAIDAAFEEGRWAFGATAEFRGNGIAIRRDLLIAAGGWRAVVTEDLDLSARLAVTTTARIAWPTEPLVGELPTINGRDLWNQRVRWAEGAIRSSLEWSRPLLGAGQRSIGVRTERVAYAVPLLLPFAAAAALFEGLRRRRLAAAVVIPAACVAGLTAIAADAIPRVPGSPQIAPAERIRRSLQAALFMSLWLAAVPRAAVRVAFGRGALRYMPTPHRGSSDPR